MQNRILQPIKIHGKKQYCWRKNGYNYHRFERKRLLVCRGFVECGLTCGMLKDGLLMLLA